MTNLLKSFKGQDKLTYPTREEDDAESIRKWDDLLANFKDEGKYLIIIYYL
jgi:hypothetical protein